MNIYKYLFINRGVMLVKISNLARSYFRIFPKSIQFHKIILLKKKSFAFIIIVHEKQQQQKK